MFSSLIITAYLGERFHHSSVVHPFLWLEYVKFGGMEAIPDTKFYFTQVICCLMPKITHSRSATKLEFNIYPREATETPYIYQTTPHDHWLMEGKEFS